MVDTINEEKTAAQKAQEAGLTFEEAPVLPSSPTPTPTPTPTQSIPTAESHHLLDAPHSIPKNPVDLNG